MSRFEERSNPVRRHAVTKLQTLEARHPGLQQKVQAMFAEFWPAQDVKHMIETHYGERLSLNSIARYKRQQWQNRRDLVQEMGQGLGRSGDPVMG